MHARQACQAPFPRKVSHTGFPVTIPPLHPGKDTKGTLETFSGKAPGKGMLEKVSGKAPGKGFPERHPGKASREGTLGRHFLGYLSGIHFSWFSVVESVLMVFCR